jgi:hypothetical protein
VTAAAVTPMIAATTPAFVRLSASRTVSATVWAIFVTCVLARFAVSAARSTVRSAAFRALASDVTRLVGAFRALTGDISLPAAPVLPAVFRVLVRFAPVVLRADRFFGVDFRAVPCIERDRDVAIVGLSFRWSRDSTRLIEDG